MHSLTGAEMPTNASCRASLTAASASASSAIARPTPISTFSELNTASATESSRNPAIDETSAADVAPMTLMPGKAERTLSISAGSKPSTAQNRMPTVGWTSVSWARHWSIACTTAACGSTSSLWPTAMVSIAALVLARKSSICRAPTVDRRRPRAQRSDRLGPGRSAAPGEQRLSLLPSGPDEVHASPLRGTRSSTSISPSASANAGLGWEFSPAGADCRYRAPLVPRLARRSRSYGGGGTRRRRGWVAERVGFEPTMSCPIRHFQCRALGL